MSITSVDTFWQRLVSSTMKKWFVMVPWSSRPIIIVMALHWMLSSRSLVPGSPVVAPCLQIKVLLDGLEKRSVRNLMRFNKGKSFRSSSRHWDKLGVNQKKTMVGTKMTMVLS